MKNKGILLAILLIGSAALVGCAGKINYNTKGGCFQKAYIDHSYQEVNTPGSEASKSANEIWDECRCKWNANDVITSGPNAGKKYTDVYNVNPDCSRFKK